MAGFTICMTGQKQHSLDRIFRQVHQIPGFEHIKKLELPLGEATVWLLVYEKYYLRTAYTGLTLLLAEQGDTQRAYIVSSAGGDGLANISMGANRKMAMECARALEALGFRTDPADSDEVPKNLLTRIFK